MNNFSTSLMLERSLEAYNDARPRTQQEKLGPSSIHSCRRQVWHQLNNTFKTNLNINFLPALMGTAIHALIEEAIKYEDVFGDDFLKEIEVEYEGLPAHVDLYIKSQKTVVDWKTSTKKSMTSKRFPWPSVQYQYQVHVYGYLLKHALGYEVEWVKLVGVARDGGLNDIMEWTQAYDEEVALQGIKWINDQYEASKGPAPEPERNAKTFCSNYCPFFDPTGEIGCPGLERGGFDH